jgi:hypothetical protein
MRPYLKSLGVALAIGLCTIACAKAPKLSSGAACDHLKALVAHINSAPHGPSEYRCELDTHEGSGRYYVFGLYSNFPAPPGAGPDWMGSSIEGWYAVSPLTGEIFLWDSPNLGLGKKLTDPTRKK